MARGSEEDVIRYSIAAITFIILCGVVVLEFLCAISLCDSIP